MADLPPPAPEAAPASPAEPARAAAPAKTGWLQRFGSLGGRTIVMLVVLAVLVAAADRSGLFADLSADRRFTLSPRLEQLIRDQREPVELVALWGTAVEGQLEPLEAMLKRMGAVAPLVTYRRIDPELQKPELDRFRAKYPDTQDGGLYVTRGTRAFSIAVSGYTRLVVQREVGGALVTLAEASLPPAYLLQGHGELRPAGGKEDGNSTLEHTLALAGFSAQVLDGTTAAAPSPEGIIVVAGPTAPLGERDLKRLAQHLQDGGGMLVLADDRAPDDLVVWLRRRGVAIGRPTSPDPGSDEPNPRHIIVSLKNHFTGQETVFPHHNLLLKGDQLNPQHPATFPVVVTGVPLLSPWTAPVYALQPNAQDPASRQLITRFQELGTQPFSATPLMATNPGDAWDKPRSAPLEAPTDLADHQPVPVAWAVEYQAAKDSVRAGVGGRMLVWGSRQALSDGVLAQASFSNALLLRQGATWLARRTANTDIPEAEIAQFQVDASDNTMFLLFAALIALIPCACLGVAMLTWWDRR